MVPAEPHMELLTTILGRRLVAVLRFDTAEACLVSAEAVASGGITVLEVTMTTPGAIDVIAHLSARGDMIVGVGSVRAAGDLRRAADAGARFMASPITDADVVATARSLGVVAMPGALTPGEIARAWDAGADIVKVFPMPVDGASYIRSVLGPMPDIRLAPSGGVTPTSARSYLDAGASALNVGSWLTHDDGHAAAPDVIRRRAEELVGVVRGVVV